MRVGFVENLHQIVEPVLQFLQTGAQGVDLFEPQRVIVPTGGVRAWLVPQLARRLGAQPGSPDGIVSNVRIGHIGMVNAVLRAGIADEDDHWSIDRVTMALLPVLSALPPDDPLVKKHHGPLRAARALADRFDKYAARRPDMIREWERAFLSGSQLGADNAVVEWQFGLWCEARRTIAVPPWPARALEVFAAVSAGEVEGLPSRLMIAGLESLSAANLEAVRALSHAVDIEMVCVHPSSRLAGEWAASLAEVAVTPGRAPARDEDDQVPVGAHVLPVTWMGGSRELQALLASQGIDGPSHCETWTARAPGLLGRVQTVLRDPFSRPTGNHDASDHSVQIHLAHNLARQAEILRDALLHAFEELENLRPDEIVVLCADVNAAAPLLQAVFDQPIRVPGRPALRIPFKVTDRSLREVDEGADLLAAVLSLIGSRYDVPSVMRVATNRLVLRNLGVGEDAVDSWLRHVDVTRVRWGLDVDHRRDAGLDVPAVTAHTWKQALDRALLGVLLPEADRPRHELGGNVPLAGMESSEVEALSGLSRILAALSRVEHCSTVALPVGSWCDEIEQLLVTLCGPACPEIDDTLDLVGDFRRVVPDDPAGGTASSTPVRLAEFAHLLSRRLSEPPGHQPLRTGVTVATSFVPLRSVPFRVVCVVGLDDGTLRGGESEGDDIAAQTALMGDPDPRFDTRRMLLDAVLAAEDRLIITCSGRSIKNNTKLPLVTPLAELVDLCGDLGVSVHDDPEKLSGIEHQHPRHATGTLNFHAKSGRSAHDKVPVEGVVWSHDPAALDAARKAGRPVTTVTTGRTVGQPRDLLRTEHLERILIDPLDHYLRESLHIRREYEAKDEGAVLPLTMSDSRIGEAARMLIEHVGGRRSWPDAAQTSVPETPEEAARRATWHSSVDEWRTMLDAADLLPVGEFGRMAAERAEKIAKAVWGAALAEGVPATDPDPVEGSLGLGSAGTLGYRLRNVVDGAAEPFVYTVRFDQHVDRERQRLKFALVVLRALGTNVSRAKLVHLQSKQDVAVVETYELDASVTRAEARRRIARLMRAEPIARTVPCAFFGDTGNRILATGRRDDEDVVAAFVDFVTDNFSYPRSNEYLVFGPAPDITDVFRKRPRLQLAVFAAVRSLFTERDPAPGVTVLT